MRPATLLAVVAAAGFSACGKSDGGAGAKYPGTEDGARQLLTDVRKPAVDAKALTRSLKPTTDDYQAVFEGEAAAKAEKAYEELWKDPDAAISAKPENSELKIWKATSDEIKAWGSEVRASFPGGYEQVGPRLKPGLTFYRWKYTQPGESLGMAYDGLVYVNGHWAWFPKPWRALQ